MPNPARVPGRKARKSHKIPEPDIWLKKGRHYSDKLILQLLAPPWAEHVTSPYSELADAYRLKSDSKGSIKYVVKLGGFLTWDAERGFWQSGSSQQSEGFIAAKVYAQRLNQVMVQEIRSLNKLLALAANEPVKAGALEQVIRLHEKAARLLEQNSRQKAVLSQLAPLVIADAEVFEPSAWVVGFQNGVWAPDANKKQLSFRKHEREDHLLHLADVKSPLSSKKALRSKSSDWLQVLNRISGGDKEFEMTLQDVAGYALSGASNLRLLPWIYGPAGTGKSTFSELLATVLGSMAITIDPKMLSSEASRERLGAAIWGKRVVICAEAGNQRLDLEALKTLSGSDRLSVRFLYAEAFTAKPRHVLMMVANDPPVIDQGDQAFWDRVLVLPFDQPLRKGDKDQDLLKGKSLESLRQDPDSPLVRDFTAWAIEGMKRVYQNLSQGKRDPITVAQKCVEAKIALRAETDPLDGFWAIPAVRDLFCTPQIGRVSVKDLRDIYVVWANENLMPVLSPQKFNGFAKNVGLVMKNNNGRFWELPDGNRRKFLSAETIDINDCADLPPLGQFIQIQSIN